MDWFPPLGVTPALGAYAGVAIVMVAVEVYLLFQILPREGPPPTLSRMAIGTSALLGSAAFLLSLLGLVFNPDSYSAATLVLWGLNFMMFAPPGIWVIAVIAFRDRRIDGTSWWWPASIAATATGAEVLMGLLFSVSTPIPALNGQTLAASLVSPWFDWSMAAAMVALVAWVPLSRAAREALVTLAAAGVVAPWVAASATLGALLMTAVMAVALVQAYRRLVPRADPESATVVLWVVGAFTAMSTAEWGNLALGGTGGLLVFGLLTSLVMAAELAYLARRALTGAASAAPPVALDFGNPTAAGARPAPSLGPVSPLSVALLVGSKPQALAPVEVGSKAAQIDPRQGQATRAGR